MEGHDMLRRLDRVAAPPDFEKNVIALLARRRSLRVREARSRVFRYSLAGAAAVLLATFVLLNTVVLRPGGSRGLAERAVLEQGEILPVMETVNYRSEARTASQSPEAVYILENVTYASNSRIRY
jgi:hypothetical protein